MRFVVDRVALDNLFSVRLFFLMNVISPVLPTYPHLHFAPTRRTNGGKPKSNVLSEIGDRWVESIGT